MVRWRMARWLAALFVVLFALPASAQVWRVDRHASSIGFVAPCGTATCRGAFRDFTADIVYDPADLVRARFDLRVDVGSLVLEDPASTATALGARYLDASRFPRAYLATTLFLPPEDGRIVARAELRLRGVIRTVDLDVTFIPTGAGFATLDIAARLQPRDFGIGVNEPPDRAPGPVEVHAHLVLRAAHKARADSP